MGNSFAVAEPACEATSATIRETSRDDDVWIDVRGVMAYLGMGRTRVYEMIRSGEIPAVCIGRCIRVNKHALNSLLDTWAI